MQAQGASHQGVLYGQIAAVLGVVVVGVWGATQWTAAALGHQARLGTPWFEVFGSPVYHPWRLFEWWFFFDAYAPDVFDVGGGGGGACCRPKRTLAPLPRRTCAASAGRAGQA